MKKFIIFFGILLVLMAGFFYVYEYLTCIGIANPCGKIIVPLDCKHSGANYLTDISSSGYVSDFVYAYGFADGKYICNDLNGNFLVKSEYKLKFHGDDLFIGKKIRLFGNEEYAILDRSGKICFISKHFIKHLDTNLFMDENSTVVITDDLNNISVIPHCNNVLNDNNLFCVKDPKTGKFGLKNRKNDLVTNYKFDYPIVAKKDDLYMVTTNGLYYALKNHKNYPIEEKIDSFFYVSDNMFLTLDVLNQKITFKLADGKFVLCPSNFSKSSIFSLGDKTVLKAKKDGKILFYDLDLNLIPENDPDYQKYLAEEKAAKISEPETNPYYICGKNGICTVYDSKNTKKIIKADSLNKYGDFWLDTTNEKTKTIIYDSDFNYFWEINDPNLNTEYVHTLLKENGFIISRSGAIYSLSEKKRFKNILELIKFCNKLSDADLKKLDKCFIDNLSEQYDYFPTYPFPDNNGYFIMYNPVLCKNLMLFSYYLFLDSYWLLTEIYNKID
ncbi:MAG: hypothetical protein KBT47_04565 [Armatimonadetes bacterium]|nr:hypothetical protein [Candidatus Hippobium faecium]